MEWVGKIYEWYKSGKLVSDDEVALFFDPVYFKPLYLSRWSTYGTISR